jgi:Rps23 Pro-64 3,4-dihydroxylase Tpa1-like proline 4-hydroxylase
VKKSARISKPQHTSIVIKKNFLAANLARNLRKSCDEVYKDPRSTNPRRFLWDHWHLDDQYRLHRTMARDFLPPKLYKELRDRLVQYGQDHLGCFSISEPWISYYTEGDKQELHTDSPHGPWAYVFSLTDWSHRKFSGGETLILKNSVLNYWQSYSRKAGREMSDFAHKIAPEFNQLLVFDPRLPHGVKRVHGVHEPLDGRWVVHGWFVNPEPYVTGAMNLKSATKSLNQNLPLVLAHVFQSHPELEKYIGMLTFRLKILPTGKVSSIGCLTNSLVNVEKPHFSDAALLKIVSVFSHELRQLQFAKFRSRSELTLPLIFD